MSALPATIVAQVDSGEVGRLLHSKELSNAKDARALHDEISRGLPSEVLDGLREIGYSVDEIARVTANSSRTIQRYLADRRREARLNLATSDRAVRLAAAHNKTDAMEDWLYTHQPAMTPPAVRQAAHDVGQIADFDAKYAATLSLVKSDVALGRQLQVKSTLCAFK